MELTKIKNKYIDLVKEINYFNKVYYQENVSEITDEEYDKLFLELKIIEKNHPELIDPESPTFCVGSDIIEKFKTYNHSVPMLSIDNSYNMDDIRNFVKRVQKKLKDKIPNIYDLILQYIVTPKIDGMAITLLYKQNKFIKAVTRGNGELGEDVTHNVMKIKNIPKILNSDELIDLEIRGEIYMKNSVFHNLNIKREKNGEDKLKNPRNATAGLIKRLDSRELKDIELSFLGYSIISDAYYTYESELSDIKKFGFDPIDYTVLNDINDFEKISEKWKLIKREYDTDGLVIKINDNSYKNHLGATSHHPNYIMAYKYPSEGVITKLLDIELNVGKSGNITPVAILEPVDYNGTTIKRSTLHNFKHIEELGLMYGDHVTIIKAGEIIPKVVNVIKEKRDGTEKVINVPKVCHNCYEGLNTNDLKNIRCMNKKCSDMFLNSIQYCISEKCFDMKGISKQTLKKIIDNKLIYDVTDLFLITKEQLLELDGIKEKSADKIIDIINECKKVPFVHVLCSLNINNLGKTVSKTLCAEYKNIDAIMKATVSELSSLDGVGSLIAQNIYNGLRDTEKINQINFYKKHGFNLSEEIKKEEITNVSSTSKKLQNLNFCITGTLSEPRKHFETLIIQNGGLPSSSITKHVQYLLAGDKAGSKIEKAKKLGITIINEEEFFDLINQ